jgi:hypothetical protein
MHGGEKALLALVVLMAIGAVAGVYLLRGWVQHKLNAQAAAGSSANNLSPVHAGLGPPLDDDSDTGAILTAPVCPGCQAALSTATVSFCTTCGHALPDSLAADLKAYQDEVNLQKLKQQQQHQQRMRNAVAVDVSGRDAASEDDRVHMEGNMSGANDGHFIVPDYQLSVKAKQARDVAQQLLSRGYVSTGAVAKKASGRLMDWLRLCGRFLAGWSRYGLVVVTKAR